MNSLCGAAYQRHLCLGLSSFEVPPHKLKLRTKQADAAILDRQKPYQPPGFVPIAEHDQNLGKMWPKLFYFHMRPQFLVQHERGMVHAGPLCLRSCPVTSPDHGLDLIRLFEVKCGRREGPAALEPLARTAVQVTPLVGAHLAVHLALHERVDETHLTVLPFPHKPKLARLVQRSYGVPCLGLHHVGDRGQLFGSVQNDGRGSQETKRHFICPREPAPEDCVRAWRDSLRRRARLRRLGDQAQRFPQEEWVAAGQLEKTAYNGVIWLPARNCHLAGSAELDHPGAGVAHDGG